jgi:phage host-nuclease inhibitor protein Gam
MNATDVSTEKMADLLLEAAKIKLALSKITAKYDKKIKALQEKKSEAVNGLGDKLEQIHAELLELAESTSYPEDSHTIFIQDIGDVFFKELDDRLIVVDQEVTVAALKKLGYDEFIRTKEEVIHENLKELTDKELDKAGVQKETDRKYFYYKLAGERKSTRLSE